MPKDKTYTFKIEGEAKESFDKLCKENHTTPSHELSLFVHQRIKAYQSKVIRISNHRSNRT